MKKYLLIAFCLAAAGFARNASAQSYSAPVNGRQQERVQRAPAPVYVGKEIGAFPRGFRGGNPIQLINPRAPQKYRGAPQDTVVVGDSSTPQRNRGESPNRFAGVVLFGFTW